MMRRLAVILLGLVSFPPLFSTCTQVFAQRACQRPVPGSIVTEPAALRSHDGVLRVDLTYRNLQRADGQEEYCYYDNQGAMSPTLRLQAGDLLVLRLKNRLTDLPPASERNAKKVTGSDMPRMSLSSPCGGAAMTALATNLHFHGLTVPPLCHEDDVINTLIGPGEPSFEYRFRIPDDEWPGLYWYHPHVHGSTNPQVLGGASGALIVDGIERTNSSLAGLPERTFVIRDENLLHPNASPGKIGFPAPPPLIDAEGDVRNMGTGGGKPAKDLSINFVPVPFPDYPPATILVRPSERQLWRVLNASALTYIDLQFLTGNMPQAIGVVSIDSVPINEGGMARNRVLWVNHVFLPPGSRVDFIFKGVQKGAQARVITRSVDTGPAGENDPVRPLANIIATDRALETSRLSVSPRPLPLSASVWLGNVPTVRTRHLYFSERPQDPSHPDSPTEFMLTVEGQTPEPFDPQESSPSITVRQGDVEDWVIENRSPEMHAFHIHQIHFLLTQWDGVAVDEPFLRDIINVPFWDGKSSRYPSVTLRMDFRNPNIVGTFVYHCHLLEHEDGGMMGLIRVLPKPAI
jgi:FtsP/CotA-like multicopper oxidase with cupredoxin domain